MISCTNTSPYRPGANVMALTFFSPAFHVGSMGTVLKRERGRLVAIRTPDGELLKWFTIFELESADPELHRLLEGTYAYVTTDRLGATLEIGTRVQIIKRLDEIDYYEVKAHGLPEIYRVTGIDVT